MCVCALSKHFSKLQPLEIYFDKVCSLLSKSEGFLKAVVSIIHTWQERSSPNGTGGSQLHMHINGAIFSFYFIYFIIKHIFITLMNMDGEK